MRRKRNNLLNDPLVFVDIETDGLNHVRGHVIEVAAIRVEGDKITRTFTTLVDPGIELPQFITGLTGIKTSDLRGAPTFAAVADELYDILEGAIFVAHNVRFDYSFLKQEFKRIGRPFLPKQLCTMRLSRALFADQKGHRLQDLIDRYGFSYASRHRAYDDAAVLWQFIQYIQANVAVEVIDAAIAKQLRQPAIPKHIDSNLVKDLPTGPGVYIFQDEAGHPLYVGKSITVKKRVLQHFGNDHDDGKEFKIAQTVRHIETHETDGELSALLLESRLIKELQPLYNRQLRRLSKMIIARQALNAAGFIVVSLHEASTETVLRSGDTLAAYPRRSRAKASLEGILRRYQLCPKLLGLEKSSGACFWYQLGKCHGACVGAEPAERYNTRLRMAFEAYQVQAWPYRGPVLLKEADTSGIVVDNWCVIAEIAQQDDCTPTVRSRAKVFDLDTYKILQPFLATKVRQLQIMPLTTQQLTELGI